jgi:hypothetical protein
MKTVVSKWGEHGERPEPASVNDSLFGAFLASVSLEVSCAPLAAWQLVTDVRRIGEFSTECIDARWLDGATRPSDGARFEGTNRVVDEAAQSEYIWIRPCTVIAARKPERFSYMVGDRYDGTPATVWEVMIEPTTAGCRITQRFRHLPRGMSGIRHQADGDPGRAKTIIEERSLVLSAGMTETLQRMKQMLESTDTLCTP